MQIKIINWVRNYETLPEKVRAFFSTVPELTGNPHRVLWNYDQGKNPYCTAYAAAGCYTYNTGIKLTNEYIEEWAKKYITPTGVASAAFIAQQFAKDHWVKFKSFYLNSREVDTILRYQYSIIVSTIAPVGLWNKALRDGEFLSIQNGEPLQHAVHLSTGITTNLTVSHGEVLHNSWHKLTEQGFFNDFKTDRTWLLLNKYVRPLCYIIY